MGGAFQKKLVGKMSCQLMVVLGKPGKQEFKRQKSWDPMPAVENVRLPENDQI